MPDGNKIGLYWLGSEDQQDGALVLAKRPEDAAEMLHEHGPAKSVCRLVADDIQDFYIRHSSFMPRPANLAELRRLGFRIMSARQRERQLQFGNDAFRHQLTVMDEIDGEDDDTHLEP